MNAAHLISQLLEIERAIGNGDLTRMRSMVFEAEETVLGIEKEMIEILIENESLRQQMDLNERAASASSLSEPRLAAKYFVN
ncbi:MAG TPA: hypothetical protein VGF88_02020 [Acidobacteriaceae bacterium]|jgi:hypothetical protein